MKSRFGELVGDQTGSAVSHVLFGRILRKEQSAEVLFLFEATTAVKRENI